MTIRFSKTTATLVLKKLLIIYDVSQKDVGGPENQKDCLNAMRDFMKKGGAIRVASTAWVARVSRRAANDFLNYLRRQGCFKEIRTLGVIGLSGDIVGVAQGKSLFDLTEAVPKWVDP